MRNNTLSERRAFAFRKPFFPISLSAMKIFIVSILALIALSSCGRHADSGVASVDETNTVAIKLRSKPSGRISLDAFVDSVKFVKLETTDECLIGRISTVFVTDGKIIVPHGRTGEVYIFDDRGKYLSKISRMGKGPQEYAGINSAMFDPKTNQIIIFSLNDSKLLVYDLDGKFVRGISDFPDGRFVQNVKNLPNGNFLCYNGFHNSDGNVDRIGLWEADSGGKFIKWLLKPQVVHPVIGNDVSTNLHYRNGNEIGFWDVFSDDDFHYVDDTLRRIRTYDLPFKRGKDFPGIYNTDEEFATRIFMVEKGNFALSLWYDGQDKKTITILHSVKDNTILSGVTVDDGNSNTSGIPALQGQMVNNNLDDVFVEAINSTMVLMYRESSYYPPETRAMLSELTQGMSEKEIENMNPILEFYYLKK